MRLLFTKQNGCHVWYGEPSNRPINTNNLSGRGTQEKCTCTLSLGRGRLKRTGSDHSVASKLNIVAVSDVINKAAQEYIRPKSRTDRERTVSVPFPLGASQVGTHCLDLHEKPGIDEGPEILTRGCPSTWAVAPFCWDLNGLGVVVVVLRILFFRDCLLDEIDVVQPKATLRIMLDWGDRGHRTDLKCTHQNCIVD